MLSEEKYKKQLKRLLAVSWPEWREALKELTPEIASLLHGYSVPGPHGTTVVAGGYTIFGAHSNYELGGEPLTHYTSMVVEKLYDGSCEWMPENTLAEQLKKIASRIIPKEAKKYANKKKREERLGYNSKPVSLDVALLGKTDDDFDEETEYKIPDDDDNKMQDAMAEKELSDFSENDLDTIAGIVNESVDPQHQKWERICKAAEGDPELETFVQTVGESKKQKDVREKMNLTDKDRERIQQKLKRKVNKIS